MSDAGAALFGLIFLFGLIALVVLPIFILKKRKTQNELANVRQALDQLEAEAEALRPYQVIVDADAEAQRRLDEATAKADQVKLAADGEALRSIDAVNARASQILKAAEDKAADDKQKARELLERGRSAMNTAVEQSETIIAKAKERALEIAGEAMAAKGKANQYERAALAMKNIINGYGDEYIIPSRSLLDDLAEDFGYKEAGQELKKAREHTKALIKNGLAADCDYVEPSRRTFAIHFVLDAFNGKVDSALSQVKHNNYGKLKQEILDAFNLVNHNGAAFRSARIRQQYLDARLDELKWAVAAMELQKQEREEQRLIQEAMREEEKARREYEKALRETEKEEQMLQKAMQQAQKQLAAASEGQRQQLEQQLEELQRKLAEAEEKNRRALSMAQQTRRGHVYVISNIGSFGEHIYKIGLTRRLEPLDRVRELGDASVPFPFDVHAMIYNDDSPALEARIQRIFQDRQVNKVNPRKEFFNVGLAEIKRVFDEMGVEAKWTMLAEAQEYHETLAMEAKMRATADGESQALAATA